MFNAAGEEHFTLMPSALHTPVPQRAEMDQILHRRWKPADAKG